MKNKTEGSFSPIGSTINDCGLYGLFCSESETRRQRRRKNMGLWLRSLRMSHLYVFSPTWIKKMLHLSFIWTYTLIRDLRVPLQKKLYDQTDPIMCHVSCISTVGCDHRYDSILDCLKPQRNKKGQIFVWDTQRKRCFLYSRQLRNWHHFWCRASKQIFGLLILWEL